MDAPSKTIYTLLNVSASWANSGVTFSSIAFRDGITAHPEMRFGATKTVAIETYLEGQGSLPRNKGRTVNTDIIAIDVRVRVLNGNVAAANALLQSASERVRSIIKANNVRPSANPQMEATVFSGGKPLHGEGDTPPYVGNVLAVRCVYNV